MNKIFFLLGILAFNNSIAQGQFSKIHDFKKDNSYARPSGSLIGNDSVLYGCTGFGGANRLGTIMKIKTDGSKPIILHDFSYGEGTSPQNSLCLVDTMLYGLTTYGGINGAGTIFKISINGIGFMKLFDFSNESGGYSFCTLSVNGDTIFGMASSGGAFYAGTIFRLNTDGSGFVKIFDFDFTNGYDPQSALLITDSVLYGTTSKGGDVNNGVIFSIHRDGMAFRRLYSFPSDLDNSQNVNLVLHDNYFYAYLQSQEFSDKGAIFKLKTDGTEFSKYFEFTEESGYRPTGGLNCVGSELFGMTAMGGKYSMGSLFKIGLNGKLFRKIRDFQDGDGSPFNFSQPIIINSSIYVVTNKGIFQNSGAFFKVDTSGSSFSKIFEFTTAQNGCSPVGSLVNDGRLLYGFTSEGGANGVGVLYSMKEDGTEFKVIFNLSISSGNTIEGNMPIISDSTIFWTGYTGGKYNYGTIYSIQTNGKNFKKLMEFRDSLGGLPIGAMVLKDSSLFGLTLSGGKNYAGVLFKINKDGSKYTILKEFGYTDLQAYGSLTLDDEWLYGMAASVETAPTRRILFKIKTDGTGYTEFLNFNGSNGDYAVEKLTIIGSQIYGITNGGGPELTGLFFKVNKDGTGFTDLVDKKAIDCAGPHGWLNVKKNTMYGTMIIGDVSSALFKLNTDGSDFSKLVQFDTAYSGAYPGTAMTTLNNKLFGLNNIGGSYSLGTIFSYWLPPTFISKPKAETAICPDGNASISLIAQGDSLNYRWQSSSDSGGHWSDLPISDTDTLYSGVDSNTLSMFHLTNAMNGYLYRCITKDIFDQTDTSSFTRLSLNLPLSIYKNPVDTSSCSGGTVGFEIKASGFLPSYQWQVLHNNSWVDLADSAGYSGTLSNLMHVSTSPGKDSSLYRNVVKASCSASDTSLSARLMVLTPPNIYVNPMDNYTSVGYFAAFLAFATGSSLSYQWQIDQGEGWKNVKDDEVFIGSLTDSLALMNVPAKVNGSVFRCIINGVCGTADTSRTAKVCIDIDTLITTQPSNINVQEHRDTSITIVAIGSNLKYKWEKSVNNGTSWNEISDDNILQGTDSDSLRIKNISLEMNGNQFRCLVSNACSPTNTSSTARVCVEFESPISIQPSNITVPERWDTAFTVTAIGSNLNYKWEMSVDHGKSWNLISDSSFQGTDSSRLKVKNISLEMNDYQFRCIVSNTCSNTDTSLIASLNAIFNSAEEFGINSGRITNYPNPARDEITICVEDQVRGNLMLRLLNLSGQEISISKFKKADDVLKCRMKVNELPAGVYIIQVFENEEMIGICKAIIGR